MTPPDEGKWWWQPPLEELRWHWGSAYVIWYAIERDVWLAERRDDHETLRASSAGGLRDTIAADYAARPVPRPQGGS
jgi:hypothetical protein